MSRRRTGGTTEAEVEVMGGWRSFLRWLAGSTNGAGHLDVGDELEAFLDGRYLELLSAAGRPGSSEAWTWLNAIAHAPLHRVAELGERSPAAGDDPDWPGARSVVAAEVAACCKGDESVLRFLQREVLVPLELRLVGIRDLTPREMVRIALDSLRQREA